jgi:hypothetical protein
VLAALGRSLLIVDLSLLYYSPFSFRLLYTGVLSFYVMAAPYTPSMELPSYAAHRMSQSYDPNLPPAPPPKPSSQEVSRQSTPAAGQPAVPPPLTPLGDQRRYSPAVDGQQYQDQARMRDAAQIPQDPGDRWLPKLLEDKS